MIYLPYLNLTKAKIFHNFCIKWTEIGRILSYGGPLFWTHPVFADDLDELYAPEEASKYSDSDSDDNEVSLESLNGS